MVGTFLSPDFHIKSGFASSDGPAIHCWATTTAAGLAQSSVSGEKWCYSLHTFICMKNADTLITGPHTPIINPQMQQRVDFDDCDKIFNSLVTLIGSETESAIQSSSGA